MLEQLFFISGEHGAWLLSERNWLSGAVCQPANSTYWHFFLLFLPFPTLPEQTLQ